MTDDALFDAALSHAPAVSAGGDPALTHDDVQRMIDTQMSAVHSDVETQLHATETRIASATDARFTEFEARLAAKLDAAIQPLRDGLNARTTEERARQIADEELRPLRAEVGGLRQGTDQGFKRLEGMIAGLTGAMERFGNRFSGVEVQLTAWTSMRTTQDEIRAKEIAETRAETRAIAERFETHVQRVTPAFLNMQNDMYGVEGGQVGVVARVHHDHDILTRMDQALSDFIDQWTRERDEDKNATSAFSARLGPVEAFVTAEQAKRAKMREWFGKISAFMAKSLWNKILVLIAGGLGLTVIAGAFGLVSEDVARAIMALLGGQ